MLMRTFPTLDELIRRVDTDLADLVGRTDTGLLGRSVGCSPRWRCAGPTPST